MSTGWLARICCVVALLGLAACGSAPPKPVTTKLAIAAGADINPDSDGRPSPVVVRVFQLRTDAEFNGAQFFALYDNEKAVLAAGLISRDEFTVLPGQQDVRAFPIAPDARFLGVMAAFRDPAAQWRVLVPVPAKRVKNIVKDQHMTLHLNKTSVAMNTNE